MVNSVAEVFGATHTILAEDLPKQVGEIVRGGADYAFDVTGNAKVLTAAFNATTAPWMTFSSAYRL